MHFCFAPGRAALAFTAVAALAACGGAQIRKAWLTAQVQ